MIPRAVHAAPILAIAAALIALAGCAHTPPRRVVHVPVESRPTPPPPAPDTQQVTTPTDRPAPPVESVMSADEQKKTRARIVADTTEASAAVKRCAGRQLLPDQESIFDTARNYLEQVRSALKRNELWRAESLARKARQLAGSLDCPG
ncbi:MAG: hypothetical protein HY076_07050 [Candidatus Eisenbacteria bacterium]|uniref:DUF4398 domain-containing protein n=1 Tax=Eiseniibacteriota bacterium TaxID=2212470 RepID=A0A9D6L6W2_UNCEI|nr:hypothetical protein [Candidatus Eisenbacteria bacterium]